MFSQFFSEVDNSWWFNVLVASVSGCNFFWLRWKLKGWNDETWDLPKTCRNPTKLINYKYNTTTLRKKIHQNSHRPSIGIWYTVHTSPFSMNFTFQNPSSSPERFGQQVPIRSTWKVGRTAMWKWPSLFVPWRKSGWVGLRWTELASIPPALTDS